MRKISKILFLIACCVLCAFSQVSFAFVPEQPIMTLQNIRPGMKGYALTVLQGQKVSRVPLQIISILERPGGKNLILIKVPTGVASGMSGSPVYLSEKLIGGIGYGFVNGDHTIGLVTPIEEMMSVFAWQDKKINFPDIGKKVNAPLFLSGAGQSTADALKNVLGSNIQLSGAGGPGRLPIEENAKLVPGEAVAVFLVWGDVIVASTGTLTTTSKDGRFLAFAHPFLDFGAVNFPVGRAKIHLIVQNNESPFKLASPVSFVGTITQDRPQAIGGVTGKFPLSVPVSFLFKDKDSGRTAKKGFNLVMEPFLTPKMVSAICAGLINDEWARSGHGTISATFGVSGRGLEKAWRRTNMYFAETKASEIIGQEISTLMGIFFLNAFSDLHPIGFELNVEVTQEPKVMFIEGIDFSKEKVSPGDEIEIGVKLRPWRKQQQVRSFDLKVPANASGTCEIIVRSGGVDTGQINAVTEGRKSIDSFERLLKELDEVETNNELIVEFNSHSKEKDNSPSDEYMSDIRKKRIKDGTMRVFKAEYVVDGLMRKQVEIAND